MFLLHPFHIIGTILSQKDWTVVNYLVKIFLSHSSPLYLDDCIVTVLLWCKCIIVILNPSPNVTLSEEPVCGRQEGSCFFGQGKLHEESNGSKWRMKTDINQEVNWKR